MNKLHINPKWSKEEIVKCVDEYNDELLKRSPLPDEEIKNAIPLGWDADQSQCFVSGVTWCKEWLVNNLWEELINIKEQFGEKKYAEKKLNEEIQKWKYECEIGIKDRNNLRADVDELSEKLEEVTQLSDARYKECCKLADEKSACEKEWQLRGDHVTSLLGEIRSLKKQLNELL